MRGTHSSPLGLSVPVTQLQTTGAIRFSKLMTATSDGSGLINLALLADPGTVGQNYPEYAEFAALYGEVRLIQFGIQIVPAAPSVDTKSTVLVVGSTLNSPIGSPTTANVLNLPTSRLINISQMASPEGFVYSIMAPRKLIFTETSTDTSNNIAAGTMQATIYLVGSGFPNTTDVFQIMVFGLYQFRSRL